MAGSTSSIIGAELLQSALPGEQHTLLSYNGMHLCPRPVYFPPILSLAVLDCHLAYATLTHLMCLAGGL